MPETRSRAVAFDEFGGPEVLHLIDRTVSRPGPGEVTVAVVATTVAPTDIMMRDGRQAALMTQLKPPYIAGTEFSGHVLEVGDGVTHLTPGAAVMGLVNPRRQAGGAQSRFITLPAASVVTVSPEIDLVAAAALPMNAMTAKFALDALGLPQGASLLVTGAAGAAGGFTVQLARRAGLFVVADAAPANADFVRNLGASQVVPRGEGMAAAVRANWPDGVDGLIDTALLADAAAALVRDGGVGLTLRKTHPITDPRIEARYINVFDHVANTAALSWLAKLLEQRRISPRIAARLPMSDAVAANRLVEAGGVGGRVILLTNA